MASSEGRQVLSSIRDGDLQEEDIWGVSRGIRISNSRTPTIQGSSSSFTHRRLPSAARMIPRSNSNIAHEPIFAQHSAPVNIPDWSKIYGGSPKAPPTHKNSLWVDDGGRSGGWGDSDEEEADDGSMVPPHEWIDRRLARRHISSFSMCEGVGRTLKGRDLSRVRNDVLTKTGFLE